MSDPRAEYSPGLEGVIAGETAISEIRPEGVHYGGYLVSELAEKCCYEEVAHLTLHGNLPTSAELEAFRGELIAARGLPRQVAATLQSLPAGANLMDATRTGVSMLAHFDPEVDDNSHDANLRKTTRLLAQIPLVIATALHGGQGRPVPTSSARTHAAYLLELLTGQAPDELSERTLDLSLTLYTEHGYNASTFAGRVTVSTLSDLHSGVVSAIGTLKGPLHGGANEHAMKMLEQIGTLEAVDGWIAGALERRERIMGFGHRVVRQGDIRAGILRAAGERLAAARGDRRWAQMGARIEEILLDQKGLHPNVDFPCGWVYKLLGLPVESYTPVFVASRTAGWCAHIIEQLDNNRLIRPLSIYTGPAPRHVER